MAAGYGSVLSLPSPPAPSKTEPAPQQYVQTAEDRAAAFRIDQVTHAQISGALSNAYRGNMAELATINDLMLTHPVLGGIYGQRVSGAAQLILGALTERGVKLSDGNTLRVQLRPADDSPLAATLHEETLAAMARPEISLPTLIDGYMRARLAFGGLTEILWSYDGAWRWAAFVSVPGQRVRFDWVTGAPAFAYRSFSWQGVPIADFEPGTWCVWNADGNADAANFGLRGTLRRVLGDWFHVQPVAGQWAQAVERFGAPALDVASDNDADRQTATDAGAKYGAQAVFVHRLTETKVSYLANPAQGKGSDPHELFEQSRKARAAIAILGQEQTVAISQGDGSQQSVSVMEGVREDKLLGDLAAFFEGFRRDAAEPMGLRNHGPAAKGLAPIFAIQISEPISVLDRLAEIKAAEDLGLDTTPAEAYARIGWSEPPQGQETLRQRRAGMAPAANGSVLPFSGRSGR